MRQRIVDRFDTMDLHYKHPFYGSDNDNRTECPSDDNSEELDDEQLMDEDE